MTTDFFRYIGHVRPELKRLRIHMEDWYDSDQVRREIEEDYRRSLGYEEETEDEESEEDWEARQNEDAFAISERLHELRVVQISGNSLTNKGVYAILDGCPHLECLDISECGHVCFNDELKARCARLKHFIWLPRQRHNVDCLDLCIIRKEEDEDYTMPENMSEDLDLCGEAGMDYDDETCGPYWMDYSSSPSSSDDAPGPDLSNVTCDHTRFYTDIHEYYSL